MTLRTLLVAPISALLLILSMPAQAQQPGQMDAEQMRKMMEDPEAMQRMQAAMMQMQACMKDIDQQKLEAAKQKAMAASKEIEALCNAGKRDKAVSRAIELGKQMQADPTFKKMQACTEKMSGLMADMPWANMFDPDDADEAPSESDICG